MLSHKIARYTVDFVALASALIIGTPFALVILSPFLVGL